MPISLDKFLALLFAREISQRHVARVRRNIGRDRCCTHRTLTVSSHREMFSSVFACVWKICPTDSVVAHLKLSRNLFIRYSYNYVCATFSDFTLWIGLLVVKDRILRSEICEWRGGGGEWVARTFARHKTRRGGLSDFSRFQRHERIGWSGGGVETRVGEGQHCVLLSVTVSSSLVEHKGATRPLIIPFIDWHRPKEGCERKRRNI